MTGLEIIPLKGYTCGPNVPRCFRIWNPEISRIAQLVATEFRGQNNNSYKVTANSKKPELAAFYIEMLKTNAQEAVRHMLAEKQITSHTNQIPIVYSPDGGLLAASGIERGLDYFSDFKTSSFATKRGYLENVPVEVESIPDEALEIAAKSGTLIVCDDIIYQGFTLQDMLNSAEHLPQNTNIIVYASYAYGIAPNITGRSQDINDYERRFLSFKDGIPPPDKRQFNIHLYTSDIHNEEIKTDVLEVGDIIANVHSPFTNRLRERLVKRKPGQSI